MQDVFAGAEVTLSFKDEERPGYFAIVNEDMKLAELGWIKFPKLMHLGWAAQWLQYEARLKANLSHPAMEVPIFKEAVRHKFSPLLLTSLYLSGMSNTLPDLEAARPAGPACQTESSRTTLYIR